MSPGGEGVLRVVNHYSQAGSVCIEAENDAGSLAKPVTPGIGAMTAVTGSAGLTLIQGQALEATYVLQGTYRSTRIGGRIEKTYEALRDGPQTGYYLFLHGNRMPLTEGNLPMPPHVFRGYLRWMVRNSMLHVVPPASTSVFRRRTDPALLAYLNKEQPAPQ